MSSAIDLYSRRGFLISLLVPNTGPTNLLRRRVHQDERAPVRARTTVADVQGHLTAQRHIVTSRGRRSAAGARGSVPERQRVGLRLALLRPRCVLWASCADRCMDTVVPSSAESGVGFPRAQVRLLLVR